DFVKHITKVFITWAVITGLSTVMSQAQNSWPEHTISGLQHTGAIHFYITEPNLVVNIHQKDTTRSRRGLTAMLTGPDGIVHDKQLLLTPESQPLGTLQ